MERGVPVLVRFTKTQAKEGMQPLVTHFGLLGTLGTPGLECPVCFRRAAFKRGGCKPLRPDTHVVAVQMQPKAKQLQNHIQIYHILNASSASAGMRAEHVDHPSSVRMRAINPRTAELMDFLFVL